MIKNLIYFVILLLPFFVKSQAPAQTQAPAPSGVLAKAISPVQVDVIWADPYPNESGFVIERRRSGKKDFVPAGQTGPNVARFSDKDVKPDTKYYYRVAAKLPGGATQFSEPVMVGTPLDIPPAPSNLLVMIVSGKQINLMWTDNSKNEEGFILERKIGVTGIYTKLLVADADQTYFQDTSITAPGDYIYRVKAFNKGGASAYSNEYGAAIKPGEKTRISPWILAQGYTKHLNLQITGEPGKWLLTDTSNYPLEYAFEWWYFLGGKIIKTKTPLKNEPWNGNQPGRLLKMAGRLELDSFNRWEGDPSKAGGYYSDKAGMTMDSKTGSVVVFMFK